MDKLGFALACTALSTVLGGTWGALFAWLYPPAAWPVGLFLFCLCFLVLLRADREARIDEMIEEDRRLNEL